jgi:hypothetical protein
VTHPSGGDRAPLAPSSGSAGESQSGFGVGAAVAPPLITLVAVVKPRVRLVVRGRRESIDKREAPRVTVDRRQHAGASSCVASASHPNKEIRAAIAYALSRGWRLVKCSGHAWGRLFCGRGDRSGCQISVWSTPRDPDVHAEQIRRAVDKCPHKGK